MECENRSKLNKSYIEYDKNIDTDIKKRNNIDDLLTNTYWESKYVFDINENIFNPNKVSVNRFLFKLNRRIQNTEMDIHSDTEDSFKHRLRLYNTN